MLRIAALITVLALIGTAAGVSVASADWRFGCSHDKCVSACSMEGKKNCQLICDKKLSEKYASNSCKLPR
jgi:hypothetical protein